MKILAGYPARSIFALGILGLTLSACASSDIAAIKGADRSKIDTIKVTEISVSVETPKPQPNLQVLLAEELKQRVPDCSQGEVGHKLHVAVVEFEDQDVAKSIFIGDEIELGGRVELIDSATGEKTGEYYITREFAWGGFVGAAMMSDAEKSLSEDFAKIVCKDIFGVKVE